MLDDLAHGPNLEQMFDYEIFLKRTCSLSYLLYVFAFFVSFYLYLIGLFRDVRKLIKIFFHHEVNNRPTHCSKDKWLAIIQTKNFMNNK